MKVLSLFMLLSLLSSLSLASEVIHVEYKTFYSHLRKIDKEETQALRFAFGFKHIQHGGLCQLESAKIHTQKKDIPLTILDGQRFTLPTEKALKLADAKVLIEMNEAANHCDLNVQIETKPEYLSERYSAQELRFIEQQYIEFFDTMGSFLSFLMPSVKGLLLEMPENELEQNKGELPAKDGRLYIDVQTMQDATNITLSAKPIRVLANLE